MLPAWKTPNKQTNLTTVYPTLYYLSALSHPHILMVYYCSASPLYPMVYVFCWLSSLTIWCIIWLCPCPCPYGLLCAQPLSCHSPKHTLVACTYTVFYSNNRPWLEVSINICVLVSGSAGDYFEPGPCGTSCKYTSRPIWAGSLPPLSAHVQLATTNQHTLGPRLPLSRTSACIAFKLGLY